MVKFLDIEGLRKVTKYIKNTFLRKDDFKEANLGWGG